jgi:hypothetical protein
MKIIVFFVLFILISIDVISDDYLELRDQSKGVKVTHYHDILKSFQGDFRQIYFLTPPDSKQENGTGKSINSIILNERYLEFNSILEFGKDTIKNKWIIGYDGFKNKYFMSQYSNMENYPLNLEGYFDSENKSIVFEGNYPYKLINPAKIRAVLKFVSEGEFIYSYFEQIEDKEYKILEIRNFKIN